MSELSLTFFGIGDGSPCADRGHTSCLYEFPDTCLLVDAGEPISSRFKASGKPYNLIDRILISHMHFDHVGGFFMLMQGFWLEGRTKELPVHLPAPGIPPVRQLLNSACLFPELLPFDISFHGLNNQSPIAENRLTITPFLNTHLEGFRQRFERQYPDHFQSYSFLIQHDRYRIGHSADIGSIEDLEPLVANPLDLLVCELSHFKPDKLFDRLKSASIKHIVLTHLGRPFWDDIDAIKKQASDNLPHSRVTFAEERVPFTILS